MLRPQATGLIEMSATTATAGLEDCERWMDLAQADRYDKAAELECMVFNYGDRVTKFDSIGSSHVLVLLERDGLSYEGWANKGWLGDERKSPCGTNATRMKPVASVSKPTSVRTELVIGFQP